MQKSISRSEKNSKPKNPNQGVVSITPLYRSSVDVESTLGQYAKLAANPQPQRFSVWDLQNAAARLRPDQRVAKCRREMVPMHDSVDVWYRPSTGKAHLRHLITCASPWDCPICSGIISQRRQTSLSAMFALNENKYRFVMVTYTLSHTLKDSCQNVRRQLSDAYRKMASYRAFKKYKKTLGHVGDILNIEGTHTDNNGWHIHRHTIAVLDHEANDWDIHLWELELKQLWKKAVKSVGGYASLKHGVNVQSEHDKLIEYIAKFGHPPKSGGWGLSAEMTASHMKKSKDYEGRTPFQLLADYCGGDKRAGALFVEYSIAFEGAPQLRFSPGLKELLCYTEESDLEALQADEGIKADDIFIANIPQDVWKLIVRENLREQLTIAAMQGSEKVFRIWLENRLSKYKLVRIDLSKF